MPPKRQPSTIRLDPADWNTARLLVTARRCYDLSELIRDLIRQAADEPPTPKVHPAIADLAKRLGVSVDGAMTIAAELVGSLSTADLDRLVAHADRLKVPASRFLPAVARVRTEIVGELMDYSNGKASS
jgi:hypothetical protein